ncbi:MAG: hypothetical protein R2822_24220 [Spirosomataceae bacterium]
MKQAQYMIRGVMAQLYLSGLLKCTLVAGAIFVLLLPFSTHWLVPMLGASIGFLGGAYLTGLLQNKRNEAIKLIHRHIDDAEYSLHLIDRHPLNIAQELQIERLITKLQQQKMPIFWPSQAGAYLLCFCFSLGVYFGVPLLKEEKQQNEKQSKSQSPMAQNQKNVPSFVAAQLTVTPPAYTELPTQIQTDLNVAAVSGSALKWQLSFSHSNHLAVKLTNSQGKNCLSKK